MSAALFPFKSEGLRWGGAALAATALHIGVVCAFICRAQDADEEAGAPVVMMDLAPIASAPGKEQKDLPPGPEQDESEDQQASRAAQQEKAPDKPLPREETRSDDPDALQQPEKPPEPQQTTAQAAAASQAAEASAPQAADTVSEEAKGPPVGAETHKPSQAVVNWRNAMAGRLKRFHRYPREAHGAKGMAVVEFSIDREGRLLRHRLIKSSGDAALDRDAESLIGRAAPYPPPPQGASDAFLTISAPVRYDSLEKLSRDRGRGRKDSEVLPGEDGVDRRFLRQDSIGAG